MKTMNQFRRSVCNQVEDVWDLYPDLKPAEKLFMVLDHFVTEAIRTDDHTKLPSYGELAKKFDGLYINPKTGRPTSDAINWVMKLVSMIRRDKGHPHIRPYTAPFVETLVDGTEVVRNYLNLLMGKKAIASVNAKLEAQKQGLTQSQRMNRELENVKRVKKEIDHYREELQARQDDANRRKRGGRRKP